MTDTLAKIKDTLQTLSNELGRSFPIPPKTAAMLSERRKSLVHLRHVADDSRLQHFGWVMVNGEVSTHMTQAGGGLTQLDMFMLWEELAEIHDLPMAFFSALGLSIRYEPGIMKVYNRGIFYFFVNESGQPSLNPNDAVLSTPAFLRVAYDGAEAGYWDMEDVITMPPCAQIPMEMALEMANEPTIGAEVFFVKKE